MSEKILIERMEILLKIKRTKLVERSVVEDWPQCVVLQTEINLLENLLEVDT